MRKAEVVISRPVCRASARRIEAVEIASYVLPLDYRHTKKHICGVEYGSL